MTEEEADELIDALDGRPLWYIRLRRALAEIDPEAAQELEKVKNAHYPVLDDPPSEILYGAFIWHDTPQGNAYWCTLERALQKRGL